MSEQLYDVVPMEGEPSEILDLRLTKAAAFARMADSARERVRVRCLFSGTDVWAYAVELRTESGELESVHYCSFGAALYQVMLEQELGVRGLRLHGKWRTWAEYVAQEELKKARG